MKSYLFAVCTAFAALAFTGCGGGGGGVVQAADRGSTAGTGATLVQNGAVLSRNGTVRFNLYQDSQLQIVADDGTVYSPIEAPDNTFEGERVKFSFVLAQPSPLVHPHGQPIALLSLRPL